METRRVGSLLACNAELETNVLFANGKNFQTGHLYETAAKSRWPYENIWGIYLAKPRFAWMALWMAVTSREKIKKRQLKYFSPDFSAGDFLGRMGVFNPEGLPLEDTLSQEAYLYFFDLDFADFEGLDIRTKASAEEKKSALLDAGFEKRIVQKRGKDYSAYVSENKLIVDIDEWQVAVVGAKKLVPKIEIIIERGAILELAKRICSLDEEVGENYIVNL